jgi:hypothetical protein
MQYIRMLNFYLQIFTGVQRDFVVSRDRSFLDLAWWIAWPPGSPDLTPLDFSVWGYVKDKIYVSVFLASLEELRAWISEAVATTDVDMIR